MSNSPSSAPDPLPLFPLQTVLFPGSELRLRIFEPRYLELVRNSLRAGTCFGIPPIRRGNEAGTPATPYGVGTLARITDWDQGADGLLGIVVEGSERFQIIDTQIGSSGLLMAEVHWLPTPKPAAVPLPFQYLGDLLQSLLEFMPIAATAASATLGAGELLAYRLAERLPLDLEQRADLLAMDSTERQLAFCEEQVERLIKRTPTGLH